MEISPGLNPSIIGAIDEQEIDKIIFGIISILHSSKSIAESAIGESDYRECLKEQFAISQMILGITSLAIIMRNKIENMNCYNDFIVGELAEDLLSNQYRPMEFKIACHKIIHSKRLNVDMKCIYGKDCWYLTPEIHCYGEHKNVKWAAIIDIDKFCENAYKLNMK